jgi:hypothetical protein
VPADNASKRSPPKWPSSPSGHLGARCTSAHRPDAIVLDLMLSLVRGWDVAERYKDMSHGQDIRIVVVSAAGAVTRSWRLWAYFASCRSPSGSPTWSTP